MVYQIVFLPLIASIISGLFSGTINKKLADFITSLAMVASATMSVILFYKVNFENISYKIELFRWFDVGNFKIIWTLRVDTLTSVMLVVVNVVSSIVHIYSIGYMHDDEHTPRFMSYLSLFTFFMLMLVTSDNFVQLFLGWEGVGLCSYLLIGFWFKKDSANAAAMKAFIVNRVGDFGFALGIFSVFLLFGSLDFDTVFKEAVNFTNTKINILGHDFHALTLTCILLFIGSMGKSAQFGLHTWLPDAMEGPTPVSALIHAATMVTAGVFLVARCSPLFELSEVALMIVTFVGAFTCIFAATIALTQNDIKKIIAYSTCSQLGYMFFACGVSAYSAGVFHLMTHAFFKALLFLGAGSVIHALSGEQDINKMGGIWKKIPITYVLMWVGSLALAGIWPFAGFYSKDIILEAAYASGTMHGKYAFYLGLGAAFLTAFYSWRLLILVFHGKKNFSSEIESHIHESPKVMLLPLLVLAIGALFSGYVGDHVLKMVEASGDFWKGAILVNHNHESLHKAHHVPFIVKIAPLVAGVFGILFAYIAYLGMPKMPNLLARIFGPVYKFLLNKWYIDELYNTLLVRPIRCLSNILWQVIDIKLIDKFGPNGAAWLSTAFSNSISKVQNGLISQYAFIMLLFLVCLISYFIIILI